LPILIKKNKDINIKHSNKRKHLIYIKKTEIEVVTLIIR
jgi:hypothetical protein